MSMMRAMITPARMIATMTASQPQMAAGSPIAVLDALAPGNPAAPDTEIFIQGRTIAAMTKTMLPMRMSFSPMVRAENLAEMSFWLRMWAPFSGWDGVVVHRNSTSQGELQRQT